MNKEKVVYIYNEILPSQKSRNSAKCYNMDGICGCYTKWNSQRRINTAWLHLYEAPKEVKFIESRMVVSRDWEEGEMGWSDCYLGSIEFQSFKIENF